MAEDRLITVAIHTYEHAVRLKNLLESEGVPVVLHNVNLAHPVVSSGVRVRIKESDLPLALRIIENSESVETADDIDGGGNPFNNVAREYVVPVDFTPHSTMACDFAFQLAARHKASIKLLHAYLDPYVAGNAQLSDALSFDVVNAEVRDELDNESRKLMKRFSTKLRQRIKDGELPPVKFSAEVAEGVPEDVIIGYVKNANPEMIVMGTRGVDTKERQLIGSVTAEVLDSCRRPVFTIPESVTLSRPGDISHAVLFCNLDQEDILALDALYRTFDKERVEVTIINVPSKKNLRSGEAALDKLLAYCTEHYPRFSFRVAHVTLSSIEEDFKKIEKERRVDLVAVPNKKKNIFARLFNPSLAHRLLFHSDIPMMVIPV